MKPGAEWVYLDLDGTLTDPFEGIGRSVLHSLTPWGIVQDPEELRGWIGPPLRDSYIAVGLSPADAEQAVTRFRERYFEVGWRENVVYQGIPEVLEDLRERGFRLGIATSKPTEPARRIADHFGLSPHLEFVAGAALDGSRDAKADVIAWARAEFGAGSGWMVGDRSHDITGGRLQGLGTIGVLWGYGSPEELGAADHVVAAPAELLSVLALGQSDVPATP